MTAVGHKQTPKSYGVTSALREAAEACLRSGVVLMRGSSGPSEDDRESAAPESSLTPHPHAAAVADLCDAVFPR
jgi:hypothetical protein